MKRVQGVLSWDDTFMSMSKVIAQRSKDPNTQVGATIVDKNNRVLSLGYNGLPNGMSDDEDVWNRDGEYLKQKYTYVCHAEENAIINFKCNGGSLEGSTLYVTLFPCNNCAKMIVQSGIKEVVYESDKYADTPQVLAAKRIFDVCGVKYRQVSTK